MRLIKALARVIGRAVEMVGFLCTVGVVVFLHLVVLQFGIDHYTGDPRKVVFIVFGSMCYCTYLYLSYAIRTGRKPRETKTTEPTNS